MHDGEDARLWLLSNLPEFQDIPDKKFFSRHTTLPALFALAEGDIPEATRILEKQRAAGRYTSQQSVQPCLDLLEIAGDQWKTSVLLYDTGNVAALNNRAKKIRAFSDDKRHDFRAFMAAYPELPGTEITKLADQWEKLKPCEYLNNATSEKLPYAVLLHQAKKKLAAEEAKEAADRMPDSMREIYDGAPPWHKLIISETLSQLSGEEFWPFQEEYKTRFAAIKGKGQVRALAEDLPDTFKNRGKIIDIAFGKEKLTLTEQDALAEGVGIKALAGLKIKDFRKAFSILTDNHVKDEPWHASAAVGLATVFGNRAKKWLELRKQAGSDAHDASEWLPHDASTRSLEGLGDWLLKFSDRDTKDLRAVATNWPTLSPEEKKLSYKELLATIRLKVYPNIRSQAFAEEAAAWATPKEDYPGDEDIYLRSQHVPEPFDSAKRWEKDGLVGRFLPRSDPRVGFFGQHTDCCQHLGGAGRSCAISTMSDPFSQCFVIEKEGKIIAGSWAWEASNALSDPAHPDTKRKYKVVCFDNIEALPLPQEQQASALAIYQNAGQYLADAGYRKITIGTTRSDIDISSLPTAAEMLSLPKKYSGYTDASGGQVLLAENEKAPSVEKETAKVSVCGGLEDHLRAAEAVAQACYPSGWDHVSLPEGDTPKGMVLMHEEKGVIGYAVWDEEKRYITDVAVMPEERRYSQVLLNAVIDHCRADGQQWQADARESTSFPLLLANAHANRIALQVKKTSGEVVEVDVTREALPLSAQHGDDAPQVTRKEDGWEVGKRKYTLHDKEGNIVPPAALASSLIHDEPAYEIGFSASTERNRAPRTPPTNAANVTTMQINTRGNRRDV